MVFCDFANRIRNSALFHPLLYFMFGATLYYTWSLTSQNSELLEKLNTVNFALSETNKDLLKANTKLKMCQSKETSYSTSNKDLQTRLSSCETQTGEINEDLDSEKKAKQKFLLDFEVLLNSLMSDPNNILKIGSLDSVLENMEIFKNKYNEQTESKKKEVSKLQDDMKVTTGRLEEELKFFSTQNEVLQKKLQESSTFIASLKNQVDELKFQQTKVMQERGLKLRKEVNNDNVKMINLNDQKSIETVTNAPINLSKNKIRPEKVLTTLTTVKVIPNSKQEKSEEEKEEVEKEKEENEEKGKVEESTTNQNQKSELNRTEGTEVNKEEEGKNFEKSTDEDSVYKKDDTVQDEDGADENNEKNDKSPNIDKKQNNENEEDDN